MSHPGLPKTRRSAALRGLLCALSQLRLGLPQKWKACDEKITGAGGKFSSTAYFSDGKCHLVQAKIIHWNVLILAKFNLKKKKSSFDKFEMVFPCGLSFLLNGFMVKH